MLARLGPEPTKLSHALRHEGLTKPSATPAALEGVVADVLAEVARDHPHPGPTWADRLAAALRQADFLSGSGLRWAASPPASGRLGRGAIAAVCGWWGLVGGLSGIVLLAGEDQTQLVPRWLGWLLLGFGLAASVAATATWRRLPWARQSLYALAIASVVFAAGFGVALATQLPHGKVATSACLGGLGLVAICVTSARYVRRQDISAG